jgi:transcriptional regulator with XRE-family HTH domain
MSDSTLGQKIKLRREQLNISLNQLSEKSGVAKGYLWEIEDDRNSERIRPSANTIFKIAEALGTSAADLLGKKIKSNVSSIIPENLKLFAEKNHLPESDIKMLAGIQYRGERPNTQEDWQYIYESIRRTIVSKDNKK